MFDVFLSYNSSDHAIVEGLAQALRARDLAPFLDRWHLAGGQPWQDVLSNHLKESRAVAILIGPGPLGPWQKREKEFALDRQSRETGFPVIPVLLPGADDPALDFLRLNTWIDLRAGLSDERALASLAGAIQGRPPGPEEPVDPRSAICPYRGLQPFREEDTAFFFGREAFTGTLLDKLKTNPFLAVVGASGSGKSSVVRAGLVPRLRAGADGQSWEILTIVPGAEPLGALVQALDPPAPDLGRIDAIRQVKDRASGLRDGDVTLEELADAVLADQQGTDRLLLVVDQFEELYTLVPSDRAADRDRFLDLILAGTAGGGRLSIVITMRGDFFARALGRRDLADRLQDAVVNIGPLTSAGEPMSELEAVIRKPAEAVGLSFEDGLVERILADVGTEPGNLPLLEFLLTELWRLRRGGQMTNQAYSELGGVEGAIARRADDALGRLDQDELHAAKRLMLMLVRPGEGQEDTRVRAEIPDDPAIDALVQRFSGGETRLLVTSDDPLGGRTVEVSHEALIRNWAQLRSWVDENRGQLRARARVRDRMERWQKEDQPDDLLLPGGLDLEEGRALLEDAGDLPVEDLRAFIEASITADDARLAAEEAARKAAQDTKQHAQRQRRRRNLFAGALAISLVFLGLAAWLWNQAADQLLQAQITRARFLASKAQELAADGNYGTAVALARLATPEVHPDGWPSHDKIPEVRLALDAAMRGLTERHVLRGHEGWVNSAEFAPKAPRIVTASDDSTARVWDAGTGTEIAVLRAHEERVWNAEAGTVIAVQRGHVQRVVSAVFSPKGTLVATASDDNAMETWDAVTGKENLDGPRLHHANLYSVAFSPDGTLVVTAANDNSAVIWAAETLTEIAVLSALRRRGGHQDSVYDAEFSPDGKLVVTASHDATAMIWEAATGTKIAHLSGHDGPVVCAAFSPPDGTRIVTASADNTARLWDVKTGAEIAVLSGHDGGVNSAVFSPDGTRIVTASDDGTARIWDGATGKGLTVMRGHWGSVRDAEFSPDGKLVVTASYDGTARLWDSATGVEIAVMGGHEAEVFSAAFSPDGAQIVTAAADKTARIWDVVGKIKFVFFRERKGKLKSLAFTPDGTRIVTLSVDEKSEKEIEQIWDVATGAEIAVGHGHEGKATSVASWPDGTRIFIASRNKTTWIMDASTGAKIAVLRGHAGDVNSAALSSDRNRIVTASDDKTARIWDAATGAQIAVLRGHHERVTAAAFSADGKKVVTASDDGTARIWGLYPSYDALFKAATEAVEQLKPLTKAEECEYYLRTDCD